MISKFVLIFLITCVPAPLISAQIQDSIEYNNRIITGDTLNNIKVKKNNLDSDLSEKDKKRKKKKWAIIIMLSVMLLAIVSPLVASP